MDVTDGLIRGAIGIFARIELFAINGQGRSSGLFGPLDQLKKADGVGQNILGVGLVLCARMIADEVRVRYADKVQ